MDDLLKLIQDTIVRAKGVCSTMQGAISLAKDLTEKAAARIKVADDKDTLNVKTSEYLAEREEKVLKTENIIKVDEDSKARERNTKELIAKLEKAQAAFDLEKKTALSDISEKGAKATSDLSEANREWKVLNEAKEQFEIDKKNMKEDVLKELKGLK